MKKLITIITFSLIFTGFALAETCDFNRNVSLGAFWDADYNKAGGSVEVGLPITHLEDKGFLLRNNFIFSGKGGNGFGNLALGDKIIIGGFIPHGDFAISAYGFALVGAGLYSGNNKSFFQLPFMIDLSFGGGFEFQFSSFSAFVVEYGGSFPVAIGKSDSGFLNPSPCLTIGYRSYF